ncbi:serine/threonine protein kinase [Pyxidicoccus xibeiensis]|uniref:serine/threonine protein kinase n=1 Tax=Pyxidicoccus xibeiensis TaxID=2906759 RepID=UPI0020A6EC1E|nr:protein kinase [Pyxidicoccus xibeiensis]MCP3139443.1 serine/threonine protein kinase [Pyxidicoccus xibeiensis]
MTTHVGKYQRIHRLVEGIIEDYLARATGPRGVEKTLVLHCLRPDMVEDVGFPEIFLDMAREAALLSHPHLAQVFDFGVADGTYFLASERIEGPSLRRVIKHLSAQRMTLPATLCARIISQACEGLAYVHDVTDPQTNPPQRLIHRCVRPDNILLSHQGMARVVGFGTDYFRDRWTTERFTPSWSKYLYMAPEGVMGRSSDRRVDVYALGLVLYELLTARRPFDATSGKKLFDAIVSEPMVPAEQHRPDLPDALRAILARALAQERDQRYPDCRALQADLEEFILSVGEPVTPQQVVQLIQQVTAGDAPTVIAPAPPTPSGASLSGGPPTHTPGPASVRLDDDSSPGPAPRTPRTDLPDPRSPLADAPRPAPAPDGPEARARPRWGRGWLLAAAAALGFLLGGGVTLWAMGAAAEPEKAPAPAPRPMTPEPALE